MYMQNTPSSSLGPKLELHSVVIVVKHMCPLGIAASAQQDFTNANPIYTEVFG